MTLDYMFTLGLSVEIGIVLLIAAYLSVRRRDAAGNTFGWRDLVTIALIISLAALFFGGGYLIHQTGTTTSPHWYVAIKLIVGVIVAIWLVGITTDTQSPISAPHLRPTVHFRRRKSDWKEPA